MEYIIDWWTWLKGNYVGIFAVLVPIYSALEVITRLTPTKTDDTILERIGQYGKKAMDALGIPNRRKEDPGAKAEGEEMVAEGEVKEEIKKDDA